VTTNDPEHSSEILTCRGEVKVPIKMRPSSMRFKKIPRSATSQTQAVKLLRGDGGPIKPEIVPIEEEGIVAEITEVVAGEEYDLQVTLSPPWSSRQIRTNITVKTGVDEAPDSTLIVVADVERRVKAVPDRLTLLQQQETATTKTVKLIWAGDNPGKITKASSSDPKLGVRVDEVGGLQQVVVDVPAGYEFPRRLPSIIIRTDDKESPVVNIPVRSRAAGSRNTRKTDRGNMKPTPVKAEKSSKPSTAKGSTEPVAKPETVSGEAPGHEVPAATAVGKTGTRADTHSKVAKAAAIPASREFAGAKKAQSSNTAARNTQSRGTPRATVVETDAKAAKAISSRQTVKDKPAKKDPLKDKPASDHSHSGCTGHDDATPALTVEPAAPGMAPQWACANTTVHGQPVWEGKYAKFVFTVSNPGTADLLVNVKRG